MYNRYIRTENGDYTRISMADTPLPPEFSHPTPPQSVPSPPPLPAETASEFPPRPPEARAVNQLLQHFSLSDIDAGDLLLLAILFLLMRQDADEELLFALGLLLIL